jgi:hypothetical protein
MTSSVQLITNATGNVTESKPDIQSLEQNSKASNVGQTPELTHTHSTPVEDNTKIHGFEIIYG